MNKIQIIGAIMASTGKSVESLAKKHGFTRASFYNVISRRTNSKKLRDIIAAEINKPVFEIWPEEVKEKRE